MGDNESYALEYVMTQRKTLWYFEKSGANCWSHKLGNELASNKYLNKTSLSVIAAAELIECKPALANWSF